MGRLAIGVAGAVVGGFFGAPGLGFAVGGVLGGFLFPEPTQVSKGPRLSDLSVTSSAYGQSIAQVWGTMRVNGNVIWSDGLKEHKHKQTAGGGKGGPTQKSVTYTYTCSFAVGLCAGPMGAVNRIWADTKLIYDARGSSDLDIDIGDLDFRFYPGDETQMPDPHIEAKVGAGKTQAHRGLCYIVFEDLPLDNFGNRVPNITVEVSRQASVPKIYTTTTSLPGGTTAYQRDELAVDWDRGYVYMVDSDQDPRQAIIRRVRLWTMEEDRQISVFDITGRANDGFPAGIVTGQNGDLYFAVTAGNIRPIVCVDGQSLRVKGRFGDGVTYPYLDNQTFGFVGTVRMATTLVYGPTGVDEYVACGSLLGNIGVLKGGSLAYVWGAGQQVDEQQVNGLCGGMPGDIWVLGGALNAGSTVTGLYRIRITASVSTSPLSPGVVTDVEFRKVTAITPAMVETGWANFHGTPSSLVYDPTDNSVIFQVRLGNGLTVGPYYTIKWRDGDGIVWKTRAHWQMNYDASATGQFRLRRGRYVLLGAGALQQFDTSTGELTALDSSWGSTFGGVGSQCYDGDTDTVIIQSDALGLTRVSINRVNGDGEPVSRIVGDLCAQVGLSADDIDVAEMTDIVRGYAIARQVSARDGIQPLADLFLHDQVERDGKIRFQKRGRAVARQLTEGDLVRDGDGPILTETRRQEVDLPVQVTITFSDPDRDYQEQTFTARRAQLPIPTMWSSNKLGMEIAAAVKADVIKQQAEKILFSAWTERADYELPTSWAHADLDPADVVQLTMNDGSIHRFRLTSVDLGADLTVQAKAVSEEAAQYISIIKADPGDFPQQHLPYTGPTRLFILDTVLLRDQDDVGGSATRAYIAMGGYGQDGWRSGLVYRGDDPATLETVAATTAEITWGTALNALPDTHRPFATDEESELLVLLATHLDAGLSNVTQLEMLNGANAAALIRSDGQAEIIQFRNAEETAPGTWRLTGLLRGRRGSDAFTGGHDAGDAFVLLDPLAMDTMGLPVAQIGVLLYYKGVASGARLDRAELMFEGLSGNDLRPYAPVHVKAAWSGSDIALSWVRRTRLGGELRNGDFPVPLGEAFERYEVDILSATGGVLRTLTTNTPSTVYPAAQIAADFGSSPASLRLVVYQISAAIGRGFGKEVTLVL
ncbi:phage tail protein [Inquilinus sp. OTU3971]|uniref:phage tail protein n=1 Tax=Inquilinus sp. OTU3971 TaxID=3043855 RepID=UPI00313E8DA1